MGSVHSRRSRLTNKETGSEASLSQLDLDCCPEEILIQCLSFVSGEDLIHRCQLVCKLWKSIVDSNALWLAKCRRDNIYIPRFPGREGVQLDLSLRDIYMKNPYGRNLLDNWNAEDGLNHWKVERNGGNQFKVQSECPNGAHSIGFLQKEGCSKCWATSYSWCSKSQMVDLLAKGCTEAVLDVFTPSIEVSEWVAARFDCGTEYSMNVTLLSRNLSVLAEFHKDHREDQWMGGPWTRISHTFVDYKPGVRFVHFQHSGKDRQFWAGHYGPKMAAPCVKFVF